MESYFGVPKELGISKQEIGAVESIVIAVMGGQVRAKFREARRNARRTANRNSAAAESNG
jgi:hypothetical protein